MDYIPASSSTSTATSAACTTTSTAASHARLLQLPPHPLLIASTVHAAGHTATATSATATPTATARRQRASHQRRGIGRPHGHGHDGGHEAGPRHDAAAHQQLHCDDLRADLVRLLTGNGRSEQHIGREGRGTRRVHLRTRHARSTGTNHRHTAVQQRRRRCVGQHQPSGLLVCRLRSLSKTAIKETTFL